MSEYDDWLKQFNGHIRLVTDANEKILEESVKEFTRRTRERTPIGRPELWKWPAPKDYVPGTLRASWEIDKNGPYAYTVRNDQPYAYRVETGWSTQTPPNGMMRTTALEWSSIVDMIAKKYRK